MPSAVFSQHLHPPVHEHQSAPQNKLLKLNLLQVYFPSFYKIRRSSVQSLRKDWQFPVIMLKTVISLLKWNSRECAYQLWKHPAALLPVISTQGVITKSPSSTFKLKEHCAAGLGRKNYTIHKCSHVICNFYTPKQLMKETNRKNNYSKSALIRNFFS